MNLKKISHLLLILYIAFISMFALDIVSEGFTGFDLVIGLLFHLIPSFIGIGILIVSYKNTRMASGLLFLSGIATMIFYKTFQDLIVFAMISLPLIVLALMFYRVSGSTST